MFFLAKYDSVFVHMPFQDGTSCYINNASVKQLDLNVTAPNHSKPAKVIVTFFSDFFLHHR